MTHSLPTTPAIDHADITAEQVVLGSLLIDPYVMPQVATFLSASDFYLPPHQVLFNVMEGLLARDAPTDFVLVFHELEQRGDVDAAGGYNYVAALPNEVPTSLHALRYANIVLRESVARQSGQVGEQLMLGLDTANLVDQLESAKQRLGKLQELVILQKTASSREEAWDRVMAGWRGERVEEDFIPTGLEDLDWALNGGMRRGHLIVLGGRPSLGKTACAVTILHHVVIRRSGRGILYSYEMSAEEINQRLTCIEGQILLSTLQNRLPDGPVQEKALHVGAKVRAAPVDIVSAAGWTIDDISNDVNERTQQGRMDLVAIDYLQLCRYRGSEKNRTAQAEYVSGRAKEIARRCDAPVLALSQLSREPEKRAGGDPELTDLRWGGTEQDADIVLMLSNDDDNWSSPRQVVKKRLDIRKNRHGKTGRVLVGFRGEYTQFVNLGTRHSEEPSVAPMRAAVLSVAGDDEVAF